MGVEDYFDCGALCLIEWPERIDPLLPFDTVEVHISVDPATNARVLTIDTAEEEE
jgi:tRNA threonylcarbamoyladenosine biosynthesis protein TsaE